MKAQALWDNSTMDHVMAKKHLEISPDHPIMETLQQKARGRHKWQGRQGPGAAAHPQTHSSHIYCITKLGLGTDEDEVTAEEPSAAVPDEIPRLEGDEDASHMKEFIFLHIRRPSFVNMPPKGLHVHSAPNHHHLNLCFHKIGHIQHTATTGIISKISLAECSLCLIPASPSPSCQYSLGEAGIAWAVQLELDRASVGQRLLSPGLEPDEVAALRPVGELVEEQRLLQEIHLAVDQALRQPPVLVEHWGAGTSSSSMGEGLRTGFLFGSGKSVYIRKEHLKAMATHSLTYRTGSQTAQPSRPELQCRPPPHGGSMTYSA
ncbi:hypothetical protein Celaphus_00018970, partial [Cervus elaphus hippelaphus]